MTDKHFSLLAISPIDGRYAGKTKTLSNYFSEFALIKYRVLIEVEYFKALVKVPLPQLERFDVENFIKLDKICEEFSIEDAQKIKDIEAVTNHDVKAVEYFLKEKFDALGFDKYREFIHFGLTSQDINNTATPLSLKEAVQQVYLPMLNEVQEQLNRLAYDWKNVPMLAKTHGQPASPTRLGKEIGVYVARLKAQISQLEEIPFSAKFGGATGNLNAHYVTYPKHDWHDFATEFVNTQLGLNRSVPTTQIEHYDNLASLFHAQARINTILIDLCRDIWAYVSMEYFKQKVVKNEVGSSAMPHKVNPIDFENAEGNLGLANAFFNHLSEKLPISRLQRDLTDSTVLRNIGVPFGHTLIAFQSIQKGLGKLLLNQSKLQEDLEDNWMVVAEAIQNILRREAYPNPYEALKALTRGNKVVNEAVIANFIHGLAIPEGLKAELLAIRPENYLGV